MRREFRASRWPSLRELESSGGIESARRHFEYRFADDNSRVPLACHNIFLRRDFRVVVSAEPHVEFLAGRLAGGGDRS